MPRRRQSPITDFRLVPVDPRVDRKRRRLLVGGACLLLVIGFGVGVAAGNSSSFWHAAQRDRIKSLNQELEGMRQQLAVYRTDKSITSEAQDKVQQQLKEQRDQLAELQEAVTFYKNVMDPANRKEGLHIEHLQVAAKGARRYTYRLVLSQVGNNQFRPLLSGNVSWQLTGTRQGEPVTLAQQVFLNDGSDNRFSFRYFQELNGGMTLPEGVVPQKIIISAATADGQRNYQAQHTFNWTSVEQNNNAGI